jgi:hypothetical protein
MNNESIFLKSQDMPNNFSLSGSFSRKRGNIPDVQKSCVRGERIQWMTKPLCDWIGNLHIWASLGYSNNAICSDEDYKNEDSTIIHHSWIRDVNVSVFPDFCLSSPQIGDRGSRRFSIGRSLSVRSARERNDGLPLLILRMEIDENMLFSLVPPVFPQYDKSSLKTSKALRSEKHDPRRPFNDVNDSKLWVDNEPDKRSASTVSIATDRRSDAIERSVMAQSLVRTWTRWHNITLPTISYRPSSFKRYSVNQYPTEWDDHLFTPKKDTQNR